MRSVLSSVSSLQGVVQERTRSPIRRCRHVGTLTKNTLSHAYSAFPAPLLADFTPLIFMPLLLFCSILDFTRRDPSLTTRASGVGAPWRTRLLPSSWSPRTGRAPSTTTSPVPTGSTQTAARSATALRSTTPGWLMTRISTLRPAREAGARLAGISLARHSQEGRAGGALVRHCLWLSRPLRAEKRMRTVCPT